MISLGTWIRLGLILVAVVVGVWEVRRERGISPEPSAPRVPIRTHARAEIDLEGMDCLMCAAGLQNKLSKLPGVSKAEVSYQDKRALIEFDPAVIARARLVQAIEGDGFKVVAQGSPSGPSSPPPSRGR